MHRLRTFIAVEVGGNVRGRAAELVRQLRGDDVHANWVVSQNMHLTLKFLGEITQAEMVDVCRVVERASAQVESFELVFRGAGAFPNLDQPKTIWLGVEDGGDYLRELQEAIDSALHKELRFGRENRGFVPHLTIGRIKRLEDGAAFRQKLGALAEFDGDLCVVDEVVTFASFPGQQGPRYEPLAHASLR